MRHVISLAVVFLFAACQSEKVLPVKRKATAEASMEKDTIIETAHSIDISEACAVYFSPSPRDLDSLKKEVGEEDFYVIMDDNMWYTSESYTFFSTKGIPTLEAEEKQVRFHLSNGELKAFTASDDAVKWNIVLFDGRKALSIISPIDAEQGFHKLFR